MKKIKIIIFCFLILFVVTSCTQTKTTPKIQNKPGVQEPKLTTDQCLTLISGEKLTEVEFSLTSKSFIMPVFKDYVEECKEIQKYSCSNIVETLYKNFCYSIIATRYNDIGVCKLLIGDDEKNDCQAQVSRDVRYCERITDSEKKADCKEWVELRIMTDSLTPEEEEEINRRVREHVDNMLAEYTK